MLSAPFTGSSLFYQRGDKRRAWDGRCHSLIAICLTVERMATNWAAATANLKETFQVMQLKLFLIKRENIQVKSTVKSRVELKETAKLTIDPALLWIQNCSKAARKENFSLECC